MVLEQLAVGTEIFFRDVQTPATVKRYIGHSGMGEQYLADHDDGELLLTWCRASRLGERPRVVYENIERMVRLKEAMDASFQWPLAITEWADDAFGFIMKWVPVGYAYVTDFMLGKAHFKNYKVNIDAAMHIVSAFRNLHNQGLSYQDLHAGVIRIDPMNGRVFIEYSEGIAPDGMSLGIMGNPRYMAPEVVRGESMPDAKSDRHSMAVILFIMLCQAHPLEGKLALAPCLTLQLERKLYGEEPVFIMDMQNRTNCPVPGVHDGVLTVWPCLPRYMQDIFYKAFGKKALVEKPGSRPSERDWMKVLARFRSEIVACPHCRRDDPNKIVEVFCDEGGNCTCHVCGHSIRIPFRLEFVTDGYSLACVNDTRVYRSQVEECHPEVAMEPFARVARYNPEKPNLLYIKNMSVRNWHAVTPSGVEKTVQPGEIVPLKDGIRFIIGRKEIVIRKNPEETVSEISAPETTSPSDESPES